MKANFQNTLVKNAGLTLLSNGGDMWMNQIIAKGYFQTYGIQKRNSEDAKLYKTQNDNRQIVGKIVHVDDNDKNKNKYTGDG